MLQKTIRRPVSCRGIGIHSGLSSVLSLYPAGENSGITFIKDKQQVRASLDNLVATQRGTSLKGIQTVEHVLSAINGLGITNIEILLDGAEPPVLDGSSEGFVDMIRSAGIKDQNSPADILELKNEIAIVSDGAQIVASPYDHLFIETHIDYPNTIVGAQSASYDEMLDDYKKEIAPARTFGLLSEVEALKKSGLAKGASFKNAIAVLENGYSSSLRFSNELARHKILDIIGDIALAGKKVNAKIVSRKAGHRLNIELVRRLLNAPG